MLNQEHAQDAYMSDTATRIHALIHGTGESKD